MAVPNVGLRPEAVETITVAEYDLVVVESCAVTTTSTVLLPVTRDVFPEIATVALGLVGVATTVTDVVPLATVKLDPADRTDVPFKVKSDNVATVKSGDTTITASESNDFTDELEALPSVYPVRVVVTETVDVTPEGNPVTVINPLPEMATVARLSELVAAHMKAGS